MKIKFILWVILLSVSEYLISSNRSPNRHDALRILGLNNSASQNQIKTAYRALALKYHPDKLVIESDKQEAGKIMFQKISAAYKFLIDTANSPTGFTTPPESPVVTPQYDEGFEIIQHSEIHKLEHEKVRTDQENLALANQAQQYHLIKKSLTTFKNLFCADFSALDHNSELFKKFQKEHLSQRAQQTHTRSQIIASCNSKFLHILFCGTQFAPIEASTLFAMLHQKYPDEYPNINSLQLPIESRTLLQKIVGFTQALTTDPIIIGYLIYEYNK